MIGRHEVNAGLSVAGGVHAVYGQCGGFLRSERLVYGWQPKTTAACICTPLSSGSRNNSMPYPERVAAVKRAPRSGDPGLGFSLDRRPSPPAPGTVARWRSCDRQACRRGEARQWRPLYMLPVRAWEGWRCGLTERGKSRRMTTHKAIIIPMRRPE